MKTFLAKFAAHITATLDCFDRVIFRGHWQAISFPQGLEGWLAHQGITLPQFGRFAQTQSERLVLHAKATAAKHRRPYQYLPCKIRKDEEARRLAARDGITKGLIAIFAELELCHTFKLTWGRGRPRLQSSRRKCLCLYYYLLHPKLGLIHVRLQTWLPCVVQVPVNGHDWLGREMQRRGLAFDQLDNAFLRLADPARAQRIADQFCHQDWLAQLQRLARLVNPLLDGKLPPQGYYWTVDQAEFSTDLIFDSRPALAPLYRELVKHARLCFSARDVLGFLGKRLTGNLQAEVLHDCKTRIEGMRVKHRVGKNWINSPRGRLSCGGKCTTNSVASCGSRP